MPGKLKFLLFSNLIWVLVVVLVVCNGFLILQNFGLRNEVRSLIAEQKIQIGQKFESFEALDIKNTPVQVNYNETETKRLILFSSTSCPFCKKQNPFWNDLIKQVDVQKYEVIELFRDTEDRNKVWSYLVNNGFVKNDSPSDLKVLFLKEEFLNKNRLNSTPITLVLGNDGTVEKAWFGFWNKSTIADVNASLGITIKPAV